MQTDLTAEQYQRKLRSAWAQMRSKCSLPTHHSYHLYGALGIGVVRAWDDFATFVRDMGPMPNRHGVERFDQSKDFGPGNCYWASKQHKEDRRSALYSYGGKTLSLTEWEAQTGIKARTLRSRLNLGWNMKKALTVTVRAKEKSRIIRSRSYGQKTVTG